MPPLPVPSRRPTAPETPEALYDTLQGSDASVRHLWSHQADALRTYYEEHRNSENVALEFPTGAGKTLVGLLIAEWRRRMFRQPVAFVCPTNQLVHQAVTKARGYGIDVVPLIESHRCWDPADVAAFEAGGAVAVTNYHHIFNSDPKIAADTLVFDDAHAGEPAVAGRWTIEAERGSDLYAALRDVFNDTLPGHFARMIWEDGLDPRSRLEVELVAPTMVSKLEGRIAAAIDQHVTPGSPASYAWSAVRPGLASCLVYVSWAGILLRPLIAPTGTLPEFADARQRVYMSATLGQAGELERSFGVDGIARIPLPRGWERQGSGRRLALFPSLSGEPEFHASVQAAIEAAHHSLLIAPSDRQAKTAVETFVPEQMETLEKGDVKADFEAFTAAKAAVLVLANRYDGMDLPDDACRLVLLHGLPIGVHLQERFLFEKLGARESLEERIRTRISQGMGRATRNRQDFAAVVFTGRELTSFLSRESVRVSMRPELQAELSLGLDYADREIPILDVVRTFFEQGDDWKPLEEFLRELADESQAVPMPGADSLSAAVPHEIRAWHHAWRGDFRGARDHARQAVQVLAGVEVKQYRALWSYLASCWGQLVAEQAGSDVDQRLAAELQRDAKNAFTAIPWYPRFDSTVEPPATGPGYSWRAERAADWLDRHRRGPRLERELKSLAQRIESTDYKQFELGLEMLGAILGFESVRPNKRADPDCAWRAGTELWLLWEAKTMEAEEGQIPVRDIRQANSHHIWVARQLGWPEPESSVTAVVCNRAEVHADAPAVADDSLALVTADTVRELAGRAMEAIRQVAGEAPALSAEQLRKRIEEAFADHALDTQTLVEHLCATRIAGAEA